MFRHPWRYYWSMTPKSYGVEELSALTGVSTSGIKKAIAEKRIKARKVGRSWEIDPTSPQVQQWLNGAAAAREPGMQELREEVEKLRRENANLSKRVRQAEMAQRRAEKEARQLEAELAEAYRDGKDRADETARRIYDLSHDVIEQAAQENTRTLLKVVSMLANNPDRQILAGEVAPPEALPGSNQGK